MLDILRDIFAPHSTFGDRCLAFVILACIIIVVGLLGLLAYIIVDSSNISPTMTTETVIENKQIVPAHTTTTIISTGKVTVPVTTHHPDSYELCFKIEGEAIWSSVKKSFYDDTNIGDRVKVGYGRKRLSHAPKPKTITLIE